MTLHHAKHHAKHVAIINGMIEGTEMHNKTLEEIMLQAHRGGNMGLFNNAASSWNHGMYVCVCIFNHVCAFVRTCVRACVAGSSSGELCAILVSACMLVSTKHC